MKALKDAKLPQDFTLTAAPDDSGDTVATFKTPKGSRELGRVKGSNFDGTVLSQIFPKLEIPTLMRMALAAVKLPASFTLRAKPEGEEIVLSLEVPLKSNPGWKKEKRVKVKEWDLTQMGELLAWVKEARKLDNPA